MKKKLLALLIILTAILLWRMMQSQQSKSLGSLIDKAQISVGNDLKFQQTKQNLLSKLSSLPAMKDIPDEVTLAPLLPSPLRVRSYAKNSLLTNQGVLDWTNNARADYSLPPLLLNDQLNQAAERKLSDMFDRQYFDHVSPIGISPADLVTQENYSFILSGENLALGNFGDDQALVNAWMLSPDHRANILKKGYSEIGIAVAKGDFEGSLTWLAVQTFATPQSECELPDQTLLLLIEEAKSAIDDMTEEVLALKLRIETIEFPNQYSADIALEDFYEYQDERNILLEATNSQVNLYNQQITSYKDCISRIQED